MERRQNFFPRFVLVQLHIIANRVCGEKSVYRSRCELVLADDLLQQTLRIIE
jgi:hypothetical protein